ncbi:hypothetical protein [Polaromonas sp. YR568]|uniref:hypothetical protein n=1 Tax=Polaromonas sp. YR568 TaxID=1855301 RepID=UPI001113510C|nr:hypothetical protein [Polaromonas sp. YR568]
MYNQKDLQASLLFTALFVGLCMVPGALIGFATGLFAIWRGLQDKSAFFAVLGVPALIFGPFFTAVIFAVMSMGVAFLSGLVFFLVSPLLRGAMVNRSIWLLAVAGAVCGASGGAMWSINFPFGDRAHGWSGPALTMVLGCIAAMVLPYLQPYAFGDNTTFRSSEHPKPPFQ